MLHRPAVVPVPAFVLNTLAGTVSSELLNSTRVEPAPAARRGVHLRAPDDRRPGSAAALADARSAAASHRRAPDRGAGRDAPGTVVAVAHAATSGPACVAASARQRPRVAARRRAAPDDGAREPVGHPQPEQVAAAGAARRGRAPASAGP